MISSQNWQALQSLLACPACRGGLVQANGELCCERCAQRFPLLANGQLPVLIPKESELASAVDGYRKWQRVESKGTPKPSYRQSRRLPPSTAPLGKPQREAFLKSIEGGWVLNIGSGITSVISGERWINLDICPHNNVDVVADGHFLPFQDGSIDAVTSSSVFEHLKDPFQVAKEVQRVLKPGGVVWCDAPFSYPVHGAPHDYFRYTLGGLQSIYSGLEPLDMGPTKGPFSSIARFGEVAAEALLPGKLGFVLRWIIAWSLFSLKFLDPFILRRNPDAATSFYFVARKPAAAN